MGGGRGPEKTTYREGMESDRGKRDRRRRNNGEQTNTGSIFTSYNVTVPPDK